MRWSLAAAALLLAPTANAQFDDLMHHVPAEANVMMLVDVSALFDSDLAKAQGWRKQHEEEAMSRLLMVPPDAKKLVHAMRIDPHSLQAPWEVAAMTVDAQPPVSLLARAEGGYVDTIAGRDAAWTPAGAYIIHLDANVTGVVVPTDRQLASRWIEATQGSSLSNAPAYLREAGRAARRSTFVLAVDLAGMFSAEDARIALSDAGIINESVDGEDMIAVLTSVRGATLTLEVTNSIRGTFRIDFDENPVALGSSAPALISRLAGNLGLDVAGIAGWIPDLKPDSITLAGPLDTDDFQQITSILALPEPREKTIADDTVAENATPADPIAATQAYFAAVGEESTVRVGGSASVSSSIMWLDRAARSIDRLPIANVDAAAVSYARDVSAELRRASRALSDAKQKGQSAAAAITYQHRGMNTNRGQTTQYAAEARRGYQQRDQERRAAVMREESRGIEEANKVLNELSTLASDTRAALTEKYGVPF